MIKSFIFILAILILQYFCNGRNGRDELHKNADKGFLVTIKHIDGELNAKNITQKTPGSFQLQENKFNFRGKVLNFIYGNNKNSFSINSEKIIKSEFEVKDDELTLLYGLVHYDQRNDNIFTISTRIAKYKIKGKSEWEVSSKIENGYLCDELTPIGKSRLENVIELIEVHYLNKNLFVKLSNGKFEKIDKPLVNNKLAKEKICILEKQ